MTNGKKARIYGRFSSKPQERGHSKSRQIDGGNEYAKANGFTLIGEPYFDEGVSGKAGLNLHREFGRCLADSQPGDTIIVEELDRIGRQNPLLFGALIYNTTAKGITICLVKTGQIINAENVNKFADQIQIFMGAAVSHEDNQRKMRRLKATTEAGIAAGSEGKQNGTLVKFLPQCFIWNAIKQSIEVDETKADVIRRIFDLYLSGKGTTKICHTLNADKVPTLYKRNGQTIGDFKPWMETTIKKVLKNESYAGVLNAKGKRISCIPLIVDRKKFDRVQAMLAQNTVRMGKLTGRKNNLFAGIAKCKYCNGTINVNVTLGNGNKVNSYTYRCKNARLKQCPQPHKMLGAKVVESIFLSYYFGGSVESILNPQSTEAKEKIDSVKMEIAKLDSKIANLYDLVESGDKIAAERIKQRQAEKFALEDELKVLSRNVYRAENAPDVLAGLLDELEWLREDGRTIDGGEAQSAVKNAMKEHVDKLIAKMNDNEFRAKLVTQLPGIFSKVEFDCTNKTVQAFNLDGTELPLLQIQKNALTND